MLERHPAPLYPASRRRLAACTRAALADTLEPRRLLAADLVISEFLASNQNNIADNFGDRSDWIEIFNRGDAAAQLNNYYLTDNAATPLMWRFPVQTLAAGAYLLVYASDRNISVAGQPLHTNFKIGAGGEYLGLMKTDGTPQFAYAPSFPAQSTDVSYGMTSETNPSTTFQFFGTPTPGSANVASAVAATYSQPGKLFTNSIQISLSSTTPGAQIRYTTNRTAPTASSALYTGPLNLISTTMVRARVFASGYNPSPIVSQSYVRVDSTITGFDTNLGMVVVDTHGSALNDTTYVLGTGTFIDNATDGRASAADTPDYLGRIGIRIRGSSSQDFPKKQFAVELWDEANNDRSAPLMGMPSESDWILYAPYAEKSLMQNALAYDWARAMGAYAPRVKYVELYLNTSGAGLINATNHYQGIYMLVEKIKVGPDRLDIADLSPGDNTEPNISGGYLWKKDRIESDEWVVHTNSGQDFAMVEPETLSTQQNAWLTNYLNTFESVLYGSNFKDPVNGYAKYIDVGSWVDHWLLTEMGKQIDGFRLSTFYHKDRNGKIQMGPQWDFNLSMGNAYYNDGNNASGWYSDLLGNNEYPYFRRLFQDQAFKQKVVDRWTELRKTLFSDTALTADIDAYVGELSDHNGNYPVGTSPTQASNNAVVRNFKRWPQLGVYNWPNGFYDLQGRWIEDVRMMKNWLLGRVDWMDSQLLPGPVASVTSGFKSGPFSVTLTPQRVNNVETVLVSSTAPAQAIIPTSNLTGWNGISYNTAGWMSGTNGIGYDTNTAGVNFNPLIGLNVVSMQNTRTSVFARIPFQVTDVNAIQSLVLKMKFDDGFVAYINGYRVAYFNDPASPESPFFTPWNAAATAIRDDSLAITFVEWDVSAWKSVLVNGANVLAIHGLNQAANSSDLLILPELVSRTRVSSGDANTQTYYTLNGSDPLLSDGVTLNPAALLYTGALAVGATATLTSRSVRAGIWSGLSREYYVLGTDSLRVSEVMYNPSLPAGASFAAQEYEYIELTNTGTLPLNLNKYAFTKGIDFTFPNVVLEPGGFVVLAKNADAFVARYGTSVVPLGVYGGSLDNAGETLVLRDPFGAVAQAFTYDDAWYPSTDGGGASLEALAPGVLDLDFATSWRASADGSPGWADFVAPVAVAFEALYEVSPNQFAIRFSESVSASLDLADIVVTNLTTSTAMSVVSLSYDTATQTATFTFAPAIPPDGNYRVTLLGAGVRDAAGNRMADVDFSFFILAGDVNRDRTVGFDDLLILAQNYGLSGRTFSQGNIDYSADGLVGFDDLLILAQRYGTALATAAPAAVASKKRGGIADSVLR